MAVARPTEDYTKRLKLMPMTVMNVRVMRMRMRQRPVIVSMRMWLGISDRRIARPVLVLVMLVVRVQMVVLHRFVPVPVFVTLGQM